MTEQSYRFRVPGEPTALRTLLARAWPNVTKRQITAALRKRKIRVGRRTVQDAGKLLPAGALVRVDSVPSGEAGVSEVPETTVADDLIVLVPRPAWMAGTLSPNKKLSFSFRCLETRYGVSALRVTLINGDCEKLKAYLSTVNMAVLGDAQNEGVLVEGGLRMYSANLTEPDGFWPAERVFRRPTQSKKKGKATEDGTFEISQETFSAIAKGHPWVLADKETGDPGEYQAGTLVQLKTTRPGPNISARITGSHPLVARAWDFPVKGPSFEASLEGRVRKAFALRSKLHADDQTNAYRLIHGEADGLPGLAVDRLGSVLRLLYSSRCLEPLEERILALINSEGAALLGQQPTIIQVTHLRNRPQGNLECVRLIQGEMPKSEHRDGFFTVQESGLSYLVEPGLKEIHRPRPGFGLFMDQRQNRDRVCTQAKGKRWLNLFCHTGAFSVALLQAGASEVISVDLSRPYLHWLDDNLALNGLKDERHQSIKQDARRYLERLEKGDLFDGIILDPPTAASSGRRFWSVKKEVGQLITLCLNQLNRGGKLLVTRNDRRARGKLEHVIKEVAQTQGIKITNTQSAPPGPDFPRMDGFPEGDSFQGVLVQRG